MNSEWEIWDLTFKIWNLKFQISNLLSAFICVHLRFQFEILT